MASSSINNVAAGVKRHSTNRPPLFDGSNYQFWSNHMSIFMRAYDYEMWDVVLDGPYIPMKTKWKVKPWSQKSKANGLRQK